MTVPRSPRGGGAGPGPKGVPRDALSSFPPEPEAGRDQGRAWVAPGFDPPPGFDPAPGIDPQPEPPRFAPGGDAGGPGPRRAPDLSVIVALLEAARAALPRPLEAQFTAFLRELLLALRALIDRYLQRLDGGPADARVEDIPID